MQYDPIKRSLGNVFNRSVFLRRFFYNLLDLLLLRAWHIKKELRSISRNIANISSILDAGSGFGQYDYYLSKRFPEAQILGLDVKEEQVEDCNIFFTKLGKPNVKFQTADLTSIDFQAQFDLVLCVDVMEHIEEDRKVLSNYCNALKKNGVLMISTPSDQGGSDVHHDDHHDGAVGFIDEHVRDGYAISDLKEKLETAGFSRTELRYQYGWPGKISWRLSMKYPILLLNFSKLFFVILPFYYLIVFPFCLILNWMDTKIEHHTGTGLIALAWK